MRVFTMLLGMLEAGAVASVATVWPTAAWSQQPDLAQARDTIVSFAEQMCPEPALAGSETSVDAGVKLEAKLIGLVNAIADIGVTAAVDVKNSNYQGLPRSDLAQALRDAQHCRTRVLEILAGPLLGGASAAPCSMEGHILDRVTSRPLGQTQIRYFRRHTGAQGDSSVLGTTGPDGHFTIQCRDIEPGSYPLRIFVSRREWGDHVTLQTNETLAEHEQRTDVNLYVGNDLMTQQELRRQLALSQRMGPLIPGWNIAGANVASYETANAQDCAGLCRIDARCVAMTFSAKSTGCWLHGVAGERSPNSDLTSAIKLPP